MTNKAKLTEKEKKTNKKPAKGYGLGNIIGQSETMQNLRNLILRVASVDSNTLITGETGAGKKLVAKAIHFSGKRQKEKFVHVNSLTVPDAFIETTLFSGDGGTFPETLYRKAEKFGFVDKGTIFLDEICDLTLPAQAKLLRILENIGGEIGGGNSIDVRIIASTNKDIKKMIEEFRFRRDLYYRLNVIPITVPPLRDRKEDIPLLTKHFLKKLCAANNLAPKSIPQKILNKLIYHDWQGNVRELENIIERFLVIDKKDSLQIEEPTVTAPDSIDLLRLNELCGCKTAVGSKLKEVRESFEKAYIMKTIRAFNGNLTNTAKVLGLTSKTLYRHMKKYNIDKDDCRS